MARYRGTTAERGLGAPHVADKKRLMALHRDGDPCWRCGKPMYKSQGLHRGHIIDRALGGADGPAVLEHPWCNLSAGARLGNRLQPRVFIAAGHDVRCGMCGKPYHYAARSCEVCGVHYHPSGKTVRTCGRTCGVVLMRRNRMAKGWMPRLQRPKPRPKAKAPAEPYAPRSSVAYYTCRYCGELRVAGGTGQHRREVCPSRACQLARLAANNLITRRGFTREEADAAVVAYRAEGDHRQLRSTSGQIAADRRWSQMVTTVRRATERASRAG